MNCAHLKTKLLKIEIIEPFMVQNFQDWNSPKFVETYNRKGCIEATLHISVNSRKGLRTMTLPHINNSGIGKKN